MELVAAPDEPRSGSVARVRPLRLLEVVDVFDLRVRADAVVVPAEVRLTVREEDRLVLRAPERGKREVPPLREGEREEEGGQRDTDVA